MERDFHLRFFESHTRPAIERNTTERIYWNKYIGQSLDSYIKDCFDNGFPEGKIYAIIAKGHGIKLDLNERPDWAEILKSNIGSTYSRLNHRNLKINEKHLDPIKRASAIDSITEMLDRLPSSEEEYKFKLEAIRGLLE